MSGNSSTIAIADEETHLLHTSASITSSLSDGSTRAHARCVLLSSTASRFGSRTWEFATPLLLLEWSPGSLAAPAALGLTCGLFRTMVSPMLGKLADSRWDRMTTVWVGASMQSFGCLLSVGALLTASLTNRIVSLAIVITAGVIETLGAQLASIAVKKEWVPIVFDNDNLQEDSPIGENQRESVSCFSLPDHITLSFMNTTMTNIDLISAMLGPVMAGWILEVFKGTDGSMQRGFAVIAFVNALSFVPEILLLKRVYLSCPALQHKEKLVPENTVCSTRQSAGNDISPWKKWYSHPSGLPLLTISLASLYLTALSPAGVVLTAYLVTIGMSPTAIGAFRGFGAASGVLGMSLFSMLRKCNDVDDSSMSNKTAKTASVKSIERLRHLSLAFLLLEVASILVASIAFSLIDAYDKEGMTWYKMIFLGAIVVSRAGLYSFDIGVLEIEQYIVDERYRNAVGSVEGALCSLAEIGIYILSIALPSPEQFGWQVGISASAVSIGGASFGLFLCLFHMHEHSHHHDDNNDGHNHSDHVHTLQQERDLKDGYHVHLHRHQHHKCTWN